MTTIWTEFLDLEFEQFYLDVGGVRTRCLAAGRGEPLVFLHSGGGYAESFARNIAAHAEFFRVYVPDQVGFGLTERPAQSYGLANMVTFLGQFQDTIGAERILLSGLSVGAWVAALYAAEKPHRVRKLVLNSGVPLRPDKEGREQFLERCKREEHATTEDELRHVSRETIRQLFIDACNVTDELAETAYRLSFHASKAAGTKAMITSLLSEIILETDVSMQRGMQALRSIQCPTLLLWARYNPGQPLSLARRALGLIGNASLHVCERSGHWPQWEEPDAFNRAHIGFLREPSLLKHS